MHSPTPTEGLNQLAIESTSTKDEDWSSVLRRMLAIKGFYLKSGARVLDFGCGTGELVYQYRDAGFDAFGFEIRPIVKLRHPQDDGFFLFAISEKELEVNRASFRIPCSDEFFDFISSISTLEHVQDLDLAFSECARVLKPGGVSIHVFPGRYMRREPHMHVPFGGFIQNYYWYLLWALLGIRNEHQVGLSAGKTALNNLNFAKGFLNYPRLTSILEIARKHFTRVEVEPRLWEMRIPNRTTLWASALHAPMLHRIAHWWYCRFCTIVLFFMK